ncbi:MAG: hypothetical protein NVS3B28_23320 [Candidatus Velthaea sp.]
MDYSIVIPVFNREDLTRQCLATLPPTLSGAGEGEVIVVDNGSTPATASVLAEFPWVRVIRNDANLGFAAACNQGARAASGRYVVHLNNDTQALDGWLARMLARFDEADVGIVGAKLLFPNDTLQHVGVLLAPNRFGPEGFGPHHFLWGAPKNARGGLESKDFEVVTGACLVTPRELFLELGGFDERYWNGYEDVDYCLAVRARGLRVVYEATAVLYHYESQSGVQRKRRLMHNIRMLGDRWSRSVAPDSNRYAHVVGYVRRESFVSGRRTVYTSPLPATTIIVHGGQPVDAGAFVSRLRSEQSNCRIVWLAEGTAPPNIDRPSGSPARVIMRETEVRGDRYVAFISTDTLPERTWLSTLIDSVEFGSDVVASTVREAGETFDSPPLCADARCTLISLRTIPQHVRVDSAATSVDALVCDWLGRTVRMGRIIRSAHRPAARLGTLRDPSIAAACRPDPRRLEELSRPAASEATLASIVMLSWNAPQFTELAVSSIREHTSTPYEIIIVDNGSGPETIECLKKLQNVRIIYNDRNMGFAHGCNQGIAAANGTHVVLLNNDVVVTDGWLESLLDAQRRNPTIGISAPRSNFVAGHQRIYDAQYTDIAAMHTFAEDRARRFKGRLYHTDRVIGFCLCMSRDAIDEVGGIDTRYPVGNFEDDDFCLRVRAAGYEIVVCEDSFIHHFGNVSFKANNVDYSSQLTTNWGIFAERWDLPRAYPANGYDSTRAIARGFQRSADYVALPELNERSSEPVAERTYDVAFVAVVASEADWSRVAPFISNYLKEFDCDDRVVAAVAATGTCEAATLAARIERSLERAGISPERAADIDVADIDDIAAWSAGLRAERRYAFIATESLPEVEPLLERSPSALRRRAAAVVRA